MDPLKGVSEPPKTEINPINGQMDSVKVESQQINVNDNATPKRLNIAESNTQQPQQSQQESKFYTSFLHF